MSEYRNKINDFFAQGSIAVTGVSRNRQAPANAIFNRFRDSGFEAIPINPAAETVEDVRAYPTLDAVGKPIDAVFIASPPSSAKAIVEECIRQKINHIWFHSSIDNGSLDPDAARYAEDHGISVIRTGCPLMFLPPVDFGHKCIKWVLNMTGKVPR